eukprot:scaffold89742_cov75-Phaeocystis_antarctica.AAC.2
MEGDQVKFPQLNSIEHCLGEQAAEPDQGDDGEDEASEAEQAEPDEGDGSSDGELPAEDKASDFDSEGFPDPEEDAAGPPPENVEDDREGCRADMASSLPAFNGGRSPSL